MGDGTWKNCVAGEVRVDMNGIEIAGNLEIRFVSEQGVEEDCPFGVYEGVSITGACSETALGFSVIFNICDDGVALAVLLLEIDRVNLDYILN